MLGIKNLSAAILVLVLAWAVGTTFKTLGAGLYISSGPPPLCLPHPMPLHLPCLPVTAFVMFQAHVYSDDIAAPI